jgi:hypothetical protein
MRLALGLVAIASLVCACGGGDSGAPPAPASIDGTWRATALASGESLDLVLTSREDVVSGAGAYTRSGRTGVLAVAGSYRAPVVALTFNYDNGDTALYAATARGDNRIEGRLAFQNGPTAELALDRR